MNKPLKLLFLLLLFPVVFYAQTTLTGLWMGTLSNDSTGLRKKQSFELALTQYKGKVYGYSRMNFFFNDTLYYIVKRVKGTVDGDVCEVKDDEIITHNYPRHPDKGVKLINTFRRSIEDSIWRLDGEWRTTASKKHGYFAITGKISLTSEADFSKSKIFPHLEELHLADDVAFYNDTKKKEAESIEKNAIVKTTSSPKGKINTASPGIKESREEDDHARVKVTLPAASTSQPAASNANRTSIDAEPATLNSEKEQTETKIEEEPAFTGLKKSTAPANRPSSKPASDLHGTTTAPVVKSEQTNVRLNEIKPPQTIEEPTIKPQQTQDLVTTTTHPGGDVPGILKPATMVSPIVALVKERKTIAPQLVEFVSDSLEIKLYDNGEVDGDTVSILMNGTVLMSKQGLKASAIRKTIYIPKDSDEITLVLYAENLGRYPPNTGLVVIRDGEEDYQIRFSADLQQNASIILRRKK